MKVFKLLVAIALFTYGPTVFAQAMGMGGMGGMGMGAPLPAFAELDKDEDGKVSKEELAAAIPERGVERILSNFDKDEDGFLTEEEFNARPQARQ